MGRNKASFFFFLKTNRFRLLPIKPPVLLFHPFIMALPSSPPSGGSTSGLNPHRLPALRLNSCDSLDQAALFFPPITPTFSTPACDFLVAWERRDEWIAGLRLSYTYRDIFFDVLSQSDFIGRCCNCLRILVSLLCARPDDKLFMCPQAFVKQ